MDLSFGDNAVRLLCMLGGGDKARFVGGCVRNALWGDAVSDIDIATVHKPAQVQVILSSYDIKVIPTGIDHGTVTALVGGESFEITTLRSDVATDGRRAQVTYTTSWLDDAKRRDFTVNALYADSDGQVFDPLGAGLRDLRRKHLVFIGDAKARIEEDVLRILRFYRFQAQYDFASVDAQSQQACQQMASLIPNLSRERITQELTKIILAPNALSVLDMMQQDHILPSLFKQAIDWAHCADIFTAQDTFDYVDVTARLCALADSLKAVDGFMVLTNAQKKMWKAIEQAQHILQQNGTDDHALKLCLYKVVRDAALQGYLLSASKPYERLDFLQTQPIPVLPISGADLLKEGFVQGPELGAELKRREQVWIDNDFSD